MEIARFIRSWLQGRLKSGFHVTLLRLRFGRSNGKIVDQVIWKKEGGKQNGELDTRETGGGWGC